ncbi:hypothetical protein AB0J83_48910 [Actinoplanes sp. NPDC049596]|uniref:hypothetical protein n=1 Tax=unclassified Actinoplanes TaxID=2626549 RepID=UPI0034346B39
MNRWTRYLWQALTALGEADFQTRYDCEAHHRFHVDLDDDTSVRQAFRAIVEWEYGPFAFKNGR